MRKCLPADFYLVAIPHPSFLYPCGHQAGYGIEALTCIVIAQTFILGRIYASTNRSLFYVHLHHQLLNEFGQAFPLCPVFIGGNQLPWWAFCLLLLLMVVKPSLD
jgi:hypothetical protein